MNKISIKAATKKVLPGYFQNINNLKAEVNELKSRIMSLEWDLNYLTQAASDGNKELILQQWYQKCRRGRLNISNPQTFNEKIQWLKLYDNSDIKTKLADKYLVREFIKKAIGKKYLIDLLGVFDDAEKIDFSKLPKKFVIKTNHGSGYNEIINDKNKINQETIKEKFNIWLNENFAYINGLELQYKDLKPKIIIEEFVNCRYEYQFWCFNGTPKFVSVIQNPHGENKKITYDMDWNKLDFVTSLPKMNHQIKRPKCFNEMKQIAKKLCKNFCFVRVDLIFTGNKILFSEMTFTPASGLCNWSPQEYDMICGRMLKLPMKKHE